MKPFGAIIFAIKKLSNVYSCHVYNDWMTWTVIEDYINVWALKLHKANTVLKPMQF